MTTLNELSEDFTSLSVAAVDHLLRLTASWSLLADLSFSDMILCSPDEHSSGNEHFVVLGQVRPNNRSTLIVDDFIGTIRPSSEWPLVRQAFESGNRAVGEVALPAIAQAVPVWCIPVRFDGRVIAVLVRLQGPLRGPASLYEQAYLSIFERLCSMVSDATFPYREDTVAGPGMPRVGDGIILINEVGEVEFATPNATNALHRLGVYTSTEGKTFPQAGLRLRVVERCLEYGIPAMEEVDRSSDVAILFHCVPLFDRGLVTGVVVLLRDVSDLRQLNRLVLNKEAAVREVHHRVKNNLQTISSLLRLQARRSDEIETVVALQEAERRVRSIAVVHEVLSREPGEEVVFDEIVRSIVLLVEDTVLALHPVEIVVNGELGTLPTDLATPLALALTELLTNAVEHAFIDFGGPENEHVGVVTLDLSLEGDDAIAEIRDNGRGLEDDFMLDVATSLGLSIVRDLVRSQLNGTIEMSNMPYADGGGTLIRVVVPTQMKN
ncbi:MAG: sensor histidine kinase [Acidimicrobiaceae bacterium]|nr:sensor histidine kinase [Acidimicrobiaceae bacterium]